MTSLTITKETDNNEDLDNLLFKMLDIKQTLTNNGEVAVRSGLGGGFQHTQSQNGEPFQAALTDLHTRSVRTINKKEFINLIKGAISYIPSSGKIKAEYMSMIIRLLFNLRECIDDDGSSLGKGERDLSYILFYELFCVDKELLKKLLPIFVSKYGSYLDLKKFYLYVKNKNSKNNNFDNELLDECVNIFVNTILEDYKSKNKKVSLAAKWAPTANKKISKLTENNARILSRMGRRIAEGIYLKQFPEEKRSSIDLERAKKWLRSSYRRILSNLRSEEHLDIVEVKMSDPNNKWSEIEPSKVPAGAINKYGKLAFQNKNRDGTIRSDKVDRIKSAENFKDAFKKAIKTGKGIHGKNSGIYKIARYYVVGGDYDESVEAQFNNLMKEFKDNLNNKVFPKAIPICDVSGSMTCNNRIPLTVSIGLSIVLSLLLPEPWNKRILTFSENPRFHKISGNSLHEMIKSIFHDDWGMTTNFGKALNMILDTLNDYEEANNGKKFPEELLPEFLIIFSDMQFDKADSNFSRYNNTQSYRSGAKSSSGMLHPLANIQRAFSEKGYVCPKVVFWNLGTNDALPCESISPGAYTMSGFSENMLKALLKNDFCYLSNMAWEGLKCIIDDERYSVIDDIVMKHYGYSNNNFKTN